jgi:lysozyme
MAVMLRFGSSGDDVIALQKLLLAAGCDPQGEDGDFGRDTDDAVLRFQRIHGLVADGEVMWPTGQTADALHLVADVPAPVVPDDAVTLATNFEGFSSAPYQDPAGVWTIGFGSTRDTAGNPVTALTPHVTRQQGLGLMRRDLEAAATTVSADVKVPLTADEAAALDSFIYNVGAGNFAGSTLLRDINAGRMEQAADQFPLWDHAGGQVLAGLLRRRQAERTEFLGGTASA